MCVDEYHHERRKLFLFFYLYICIYIGIAHAFMVTLQPVMTGRCFAELYLYCAVRMDEVKSSPRSIPHSCVVCGEVGGGLLLIISHC